MTAEPENKEDNATPAAEQMLLEEFRVLKAEIAMLDQRVERGISVLLAINAIAYSGIYLGVLPWFQLDEAGRDAVGGQLSDLSKPLAWILLVFNVVFGTRYVFSTKHIDQIGSYIARLEDAIYRGVNSSNLGWESSLRGRAADGLSKKPTFVDVFRRYIVWIVIGGLNILVLTDVYEFTNLIGAK